MPRVLSADEVAHLGLSATPPAGAGPRVLSPDEVAQLGLDQEEPGELESFGRGAAQGLTFGASDEITGGLEGLWDKIKGDPKALAELYMLHRNEARAANDKAREANPGAFTTGKVVGGIGSNAALALATGGTSIPEQIALGAASGGLNALGESKELDANALKEAAVGAGIGGVAGGLGGLAGRAIGKGLGAIGQKVEGLAGAKVAQAEETALAKGAADAAKEVGAARGTLGATTQQANRLVENLQRLVSAGTATPEQTATLQSLSDSGVVQELQRRLLDRTLEELPGKAAEVEAARAGFETVAAGEGARAKDLAEQMLSPKEALNQVVSRVKRYVPRAVGAALGAPHGAVGAFEGMAGGQVLGPMRDALKRAAVHPAVQKLAYGSLGKVGKALQANPALLGKYGGVLARAAANGTLPAAHYSLAQKSPAYQETLKKLDEEKDSGQGEE